MRRFYAKAMVHQIETFPSKVEAVVATRKIEMAAQKVELEREAAELALKEQQALAAATRLAPQPSKGKEAAHAAHIVTKEKVVEKHIDSNENAAVGDALNNLLISSDVETGTATSADSATDAEGGASPVKGGRVGQQIAEAQEAGKLLKIPSETVVGQA